jgi:hypothetical protein
MYIPTWIGTYAWGLTKEKDKKQEHLKDKISEKKEEMEEGPTS